MSSTKDRAVVSTKILLGEIAAFSTRNKESIEQYREALVAVIHVLAQAVKKVDDELREREQPLNGDKPIILPAQIVGTIDRYNAIPPDKLSEIGNLEALNLVAAIGEHVARIVKAQA